MRAPFPVVVFVAATWGIASCRCGPEPCRTPARGEGLEEEVCIPGGVFVMGHEKLPKPTDYSPLMPNFPANTWAPPHEVYLSPFYIDKYEVTWGRFRRCVESGICRVSWLDEPERTVYNQDPTNASRPVNGLSYDEASAFCLWNGKRLPTEAEWERAARGSKSFDYPWGNDQPQPGEIDYQRDYVSLFTNPSGPVPGIGPPAVGTNAKDVSPEGVHDLHASVVEWVLDWYDPFYYQRSPRENPSGPLGPMFFEVPHEYGPGPGTSQRVAGYRVSRGGGGVIELASYGDWNGKAVPVWMGRGGRAPDYFISPGVRCARDDFARNVLPVSGVQLYQNIRWRPIPRGGR